MPDNYDNLSREQLIGLLRRRDLGRRLGLVWERDEIEHERLLSDEIPLLELDEALSRGTGPWRDFLIEGDNFPALRFLRAAFKGRVKCIYIDPPYNTGNRDFVYNDRYLDSDNAFRHSTWLEFLYRRLTLARDLLREDGVLLVSINDENRAYLELLLSQIWPGGRIGSLVWRTKDTGNDAGHNLSQVHEHVLVYANELFSFVGRSIDRSKYRNPDNDPEGDWCPDPLTCNKTYKERENLYYPIMDPKTGYWYPCDPNRVWGYATESKAKNGKLRSESIEVLLKNGLVWFPDCEKTEVKIYRTKDELVKAIRNGTGPCLPKKKTPLLREDLPDIDFWIGKPIAPGRPSKKSYLKHREKNSAPVSSWIAGVNEEIDYCFDADSEYIEVLRSPRVGVGTDELTAIIGEKLFNFPKPTGLMKSLVDQSTGPGDIVLDFFAGSATTAQAVAELNERDAQAARKAGESAPKPRHWIMVSSTEATTDEPDKNICRDVAARRLAALGLAYAYLRMRSAPVSFDGRGIEDDWLEPSLQLLLASRVGSSSGETDGRIAWIEGEDSVVAYIRELSKTVLEELEAYESPAGKTAIVATFQPGALKQRLGQRPDMRFVALPDFLVKNLASIGAKP